MHRSDQLTVIPLWPNGAPGSEDWTQQERETLAPPPFDFMTVRNVTQPTLTAFLPHLSKASGTAVVVCPGGGFHMLAIDHEGREVAQLLSERGVAAFVLKYRLVQTTADDEDFVKLMQKLFLSPEPNRVRELTRQVVPLAVADGKQAIKVVRRHDSEWGIVQDHIGMLGFSAGARVTVGVALEYDGESRPNFAAPIYGALWEEIAIPADAPPLFIALASDDELVGVDSSVALYSAWRAAGHSVELHIYAQGGHGFGMKKQGLPVDRWIDQFGEWLDGESFFA
jgi:acetyl esterase/lipase